MTKGVCVIGALEGFDLTGGCFAKAEGFAFVVSFDDLELTEAEL